MGSTEKPPFGPSAFGKLALVFLRRRRDPCLGLLERHSRLQPARCREVVTLVGRVRRELERIPDLWLWPVLGEVERIAKHAHDGVGLAAQRNRFPDHVLRTIEAGLPESLADDDDPFGVGHVFRRGEAAAADDRRAEELEEVDRHLAGPQLLRERAPGVVHDAGAEDRDVLDDRIERFPVLELGGGGSRARPLRRRVEKQHQAVGIEERNRPQQDGVHDRENRRIGANPQRERGHRRTGERGTLPEHPQRIASDL